MILAGHQPNFLPNLAFFSKMKQSDLFVISTNIRFETRDGWQRRNKIKTFNGDLWITVPTIGSENQLIKDVMISNQTPWRRKHKVTLEKVYSNKKGSNLIPILTKPYENEWTKLADINIAFIKIIKDILDIKTPLVIDNENAEVKEKIYIAMCKKYNADIFLSGLGAKHYLADSNLENLKKNNIRLIFLGKDLSNYKYSTVHYLLTYGKEWVKNVI